MKVVAVALLSASSLFIDALPVETHAVLGRFGLPMVTIVAGATYFWLKVRTAEMYSRYDPPESEVAGFVSLSSYQKSGDFLFKGRA